MTVNVLEYAMSGVQDPSGKFAAITPADDTDLPTFTRSIYVGGAGNISVIQAADQSAAAVVFTSVAAGSILPIRAARIRSTGTTATNIVALY